MPSGRFAPRSRSCGLTGIRSGVSPPTMAAWRWGGESAPTSNRPLRAGREPVRGWGARPVADRVAGQDSGRARPRTFRPSRRICIPRCSHWQVPDAPSHLVDGVSLASQLRGGPARIARDLLALPHYHSGGATPYGAVRSGSWKWIEYDEPGRRPELYDLSCDPGESTNQSLQNPEVAGQRARSRSLA